MQKNKGFVKFLTITLTAISIFYLSFTFVTYKYYQQAKNYAKGIPYLETKYLDSLSKKKVWLGYSLEKCREMEINLGLDLKGGMNVILEIPTSDIVKALSDNNSDPLFNKALLQSINLQKKGQNDLLSYFSSIYKKLDPNAKLAVIFNTYELREKIHPQSSNEEVISVLKNELKNIYNNSFNIIRSRIDKFGIVAPTIQLMNKEGLISIELPGIKDPNRVRHLLQGTANLEFWETYLASEIHPILTLANNFIRDSLRVNNQHFKKIKIENFNKKNIKNTSIKKQKISTEENALYPLLSLFKNKTQTNNSCIVASVGKTIKKKIDNYINNSKVKNLLNDNRISLKWTVNPTSEDGNLYNLIALKINYIDNKPKPILSGDIVQDANACFSQNSHYSEINMTMKNEASKIWARLTKDNIGKSIAIVLDNLVYSYPIINSEINGGSSQIKGNFTPKQAKDLANILKAGKMLVRAKIVQEEIVGPSLGKQTINQGLISFIFALVILILYLIFIYNLTPGLIASCALIFNLFFSFGVMASFHTVLTLSSIVGILLALALAVDTNVLIYERIKEEIRNGNTLKKAIENGYKKEFPAIFDANIASIIIGVILLFFGTSQIRGFAFTLIIGVIISFFTSVFLTRSSYETFLTKNELQNICFTTKISKKIFVNPSFNFFKRKTLLYIISSIITIFCIFIFLFKGLNQGIDYTGGHNYIIEFNKNVNTVQIKKLIKPHFKNHTVNVTTIGSNNRIRISTNYMIESNHPQIDILINKKLYKSLNTLLPKETTYKQFVEEYIKSQQKIGPNIAENSKHKAIYSVIISTLAIGVYVLLRFKDISYSIGSIIALFFDVLFVLGAYSLLCGFAPFSLEIDQACIGAILAVIVYSINDKVIIFNRIREYSKLYPLKDKLEAFNTSLNSSIDRIFNTSTSTLIVLLIIFFLGGESVRNFSFTMILGVLIGTISSLFIAVPITHEIQLKRKK